MKSKSLFICIYQKNPSTSNWIDTTVQVAFKITSDELCLTTKLLSSIMIIFATQQPHQDIEQKVPPLILQANQHVPVWIQVLQQNSNRTNILVQYKRHDNLIYDEQKYTLIKSVKAKVKPWTKITASLTNMIMKDEISVNLWRVLNRLSLRFILFGFNTT